MVRKWVARAEVASRHPSIASLEGAYANPRGVLLSMDLSVVAATDAIRRLRRVQPVFARIR